MYYPLFMHEFLSNHSIDACVCCQSCLFLRVWSFILMGGLALQVGTWGYSRLYIAYLIENSCFQSLPQLEARSLSTSPTRPPSPLSTALADLPPATVQPY